MQKRLSINYIKETTIKISNYENQKAQIKEWAAIETFNYWMNIGVFNTPKCNLPIFNEGGFSSLTFASKQPKIMAEKVPHKMMSQAFRNMPKSHQVYIDLRFLQRLTIKELCTRLDVGEDFIKNRTREAVRALFKQRSVEYKKHYDNINKK